MMRCKHFSSLAATLLSVSLIILLMTSCSETQRTDAYRYDHVATIADKYTGIILDTSPEDMKMQYLLLDLRARRYKLYQQGDSLLADYFIESIVNGVHEADPAKASILFSSIPNNPFRR